MLVRVNLYLKTLAQTQHCSLPLLLLHQAHTAFHYCLIPFPPVHADLLDEPWCLCTTTERHSMSFCEQSLEHGHAQDPCSDNHLVPKQLEITWSILPYEVLHPQE